MIYQEIIARLKAMPDYGNAIHYASENAFRLVELHMMGSTLDDLVELCLSHK